MKFTKKQFIDFVILSLRWYLAIYMIDYGWSKMVGDQFGVFDINILDKNIKDVDEFHLAWYLFSLNKSFNVVVGLFQILGGVLIAVNRTTLIGALFLLPILVQIFLIDCSFTTNIFGSALPIRLAAMLFSDFIILFYYKDKIIAAWHTLTSNIKITHEWWIYLLMPIVGFCLDFVWGIITMPIKLFINWLIN